MHVQVDELDLNGSYKCMGRKYKHDTSTVEVI